MIGVIGVIILGKPSGIDTAAVTTILRWVLLAETALALVIFYCWHRIPGLTERWLFPHIDDSWDGNLKFKRKLPASDGGEAKIVEDRKCATLHVHQSLKKIRLILETDESTSETLVVHAARDEDFSRFKLFYIFENRSRDGLPNNGRSYRGTAVMEIEPGRPDVLNGTYFTDQGSEGTFRFNRRPPTPDGWIRRIWHSLVGAKGAAIPLMAEPRDSLALDLDHPADDGASANSVVQP